MGGGRWDHATYDTNTTRKVKTGTTFGYSTNTSRLASSEWKAHESLDPTKFTVTGLNGEGVRESRDSTEHPNSQAITVFFDETGSMTELPKKLQTQLASLLGLLLRKGYVDDPQILFGAMGDAYSDRVPLQVGQFESDNRMDDTLDNIFLEGNGGGTNNESYDLAFYFLARHTEMDCLIKRNKKGYAFFILDERGYPAVKKDQVKHFIGDGIQEDIPFADIVKEMQQKFECYILIPNNYSFYKDENVPFWREHFGQNVIYTDAETIAETIALTIGLAEGTVDLSEAEEDLKEIGTSADKIGSVTTALSTVSAGSGGIAKVEGDLPDIDGDSSTRI